MKEENGKYFLEVGDEIAVYGGMLNGFCYYIKISRVTKTQAIAERESGRGENRFKRELRRSIGSSILFADETPRLVGCYHSSHRLVTPELRKQIAEAQYRNRLLDKVRELANDWSKLTNEHLAAVLKILEGK